MASAAVLDRSRAAVAYGLRAVPLLFQQLQSPGSESRHRALNSLCDLLHDPERLYQTVTGGFMSELGPLLRDPDPAVRTRTCDLLYQLTAHSIGRRTLLASSLLAPLSLLLDDPDGGCRVAVHRVLNRLALLPSGAEALLCLVPKLMLKLREKLQDTTEEQGGKEEEMGGKEEEFEGKEEELGGKEEEQEGPDEEGGSKQANKDPEENKQKSPSDGEEELVLLLSTLSSCSRLDALPALASEGVALLGHALSHVSAPVRREAAAAMMALSVPVEGKRQLCALGVLSVLMELLRDPDTETRVNAAGVFMNALIITSGKTQGLGLGLVPLLLDTLCSDELSADALRRPDAADPERPQRRKALVLYSLRCIAALSEAPAARCLLLEQRHRLEQRRDSDPELSRAAQTALRLIDWTP
uniref:Radial spoke head 14 homolog n=1 Tax=Neogobius melanostomus TaxID=47308 RepID=A0A8C6TAJ2_9GOBI